MFGMKQSLTMLRNAIVVVALIVGTMQIAYARGAAPAVDQMVICTGQSAVTIGIDADGNPTGVVHYCPDCAATALVAIDVSHPLLPTRIGTVFDADRPRISQPETVVVVIAHPARGPPSEG